MIKNIIFDLDGTLLNTLEDLTDSVNFALKEYNFPLKTSEQVKEAVGDGVYKLCERIIPSGADNPLLGEIVDTFKRNYKENMCNKTSPYGGIIPLLNDLKSAGYKTAVVSNKFDSAVRALCEKYFGGLIDFAAGENEYFGIKRKPAPDTVLSVMKEFGANIADTVYVGDSDVDILTAVNANIPCISVSWGFKTRDFLVKNGAKIIVRAPYEIFDILKNM